MRYIETGQCKSGKHGTKEIIIRARKCVKAWREKREAARARARARYHSEASRPPRNTLKQ
jgi:hypothetical protein